jgi:ADP-ribose pyrophosphatase
MSEPLNPEAQRHPVFSTPWFQILAMPGCDQGSPNYAIQAPDFVAVVALTAQGQLLLVRQYRFAVDSFTLELPGGHVEPGETPEEAARKELLEETGYEAETFTLLASLSPSLARFTNRMWCFFAGNAKPAADAATRREAGIDLVLYSRGLQALLAESDFHCAGSCAALFAALLQGKLGLHESESLV